MPGLYGNVGNTSVSGGNTTSLYSTNTSVNVSNNLNVNDINASGNLFVAGTGTFGGNISAPYLFGNITGNITAPGATTQVLYNDNGTISGDADFTWNQSTNVLSVNGNVSATTVSATNVVGTNLTGTLQTAAQPNITSVGTLTSLNVTGTVAGGNITTAGSVTATGNVTGGNLVTPGTVVSSGIVTTGTISANGNITSLANVSGANLITVGNVTATGNVSGNYILGNGAFLTGLPEIYGNANVASFLTTYTGNLSGGNLAIGNNATVNNNLTVGGTIFGTFSGNIAGNLVVPGGNTQVLFNNDGNAAASADFTFNDATNVMTVNGTANVGVLNAVGNISGNYIFGNGAFLSGLPEIYGNANVANFLGNGFGSNTITTTGNVSAGNVIVSGNIYTTAGGNNPVVIGEVSAVYGNVVAASDVTPGETWATVMSFTLPTAGTWLVQYVGQAVGQSSNQDNSLSMAIFDSSNVQVTNTVVAILTVGRPGANNNGAAASGTGVIILTTTGAASFTVKAIGRLTFNGGTDGGSYLTYTKLDPAFAISNVSYTGSLNFAGNITANAGNVTASSYLVGNNALVTGNVTTGGILTDNYYYANGAPISFGGTYGNANVADYLPTYTGNIRAVTGSIGIANTVANLAIGPSAGNVVVQGNMHVAGGFIRTTATDGFIFGAVTGTGNLYTAAATVNIGGTGGVVNVAGRVAATGNVSGANLNTTGRVAATGTVTAGAVTYANTDGTAGQVLTTYGNGVTYFSTVSGGSYGNAEVANFLANGFGSNTITTTGNIQTTTFKGTNFQATGSGGGALKNTSGTTQASWGGGGGDNFTVSVSTNINGANAQVDISPTGTGHVHIKPTGTGAVEIAPTNTGSMNNMVIGNATPAAANFTTVGVTGNITTSGGQFIGSGAGLTSIPGANVTGTVANAAYATAAGSATTATSATTAVTVTGNAQANITSVGTLTALTVSGNIAGGNISTTGVFTGNGSGLSSITGANVTGTVANATYATSAGSATTAVTVTGNAQANITSVGTLTSLAVSGNITSGNVSGTTGSFTTVGGTLSTAAQPNITSVGTLSALTVSGNIGTGNILTNGYFFANGTPVTFGSNTFSTIDANGTSIVADSTSDTLTLTAGSGISITGNAGTDTITISATGGGSYGNVDVANFLANGFGSNTITTTGNITGGNLIGTGIVKSGAVTITGTDGTVGQVLTTYGNGITYFSTVSGGSGSPGGANTQLQFNDGGAFAGNANMIFDKTTGNITLGNLLIQTNNANVNPLLTDINSFTSTTRPNPGRIGIGSGYGGDWGTTNDTGNRTRNARLAIVDRVLGSGLGNTTFASGVNYFETASELYAVNDSGARITDSTQFGSGRFGLNLWGPNAFGNIGGTHLVGSYNSLGAFVNIGNATVGNANVISAVATSGGVTVGGGSVANAAISMLATNVNLGTLGTWVGYGVNSTSPTTQTAPGNVFLFHNPGSGNTSQINAQYQIADQVRAANNYYFLRNDDNAAQVRLGSLRFYHEFRASTTATTGNITLTVSGPTNTGSQNFYVNPTGNLTIDAITAPVITSFDSVNTDQQVNTIKLIVEQGATPYTVTLPTGAAYRYVSGANSVPATANSTSIITWKIFTGSAGNALYNGSVETYV